MTAPIVDQVVDFYQRLFEAVFSTRFRPSISDRLRRNEVVRRVEEAADAASQSLTRFLVNQELSEQQVAEVLRGLEPLAQLIVVDEISNSNLNPESVVTRLAAQLPCPVTVGSAGCNAIYQVALHSTVQVLMQIGPVMVEWQRLNFSTVFELPRRIVDRLNQISAQLEVSAGGDQHAADERFELLYRDYLLQRFYRVEAGTVRLTTSMNVDLRELFVMPRVLPRPRRTGKTGVEKDADTPLDLQAARQLLMDVAGRAGPAGRTSGRTKPVSALQQVRRRPRTLLIGAPGSGKSTFLEWLQVQLAGAGEVLPLAGEQALPLLLKVRQLDPRNLPWDSELIARATESVDRAALMPVGWIDRQMRAGRVFFMLDGLDEVEPELRDGYIIPWLVGLYKRYPKCRYLISSRPVGYPVGALRRLAPIECDLLDFDEPQIAEYSQHWCTAVRLARNETEGEARREGDADGQRIVHDFASHPYIRHLARNPLMLSAICLVNYFEGGQLPQNRAVLYRLCVEGLLHNWDQRRGIHSEFTLEEKLHLCREVAVAMQADDRAEYEVEKVRAIFSSVLADSARADQLLEHIRYRTGLLLERRPDVFAFAHLTFQEYLAARAVHEGNRTGISATDLAREHADGRWSEVIALYCGLAPAWLAREMVEHLIAQPDSDLLPSVLAESYLSANSEMLHDAVLREEVLEQIAMAPGRVSDNRVTFALDRFPPEQVAPVANRVLGGSTIGIVSEACFWLMHHRDQVDAHFLMDCLRGWRLAEPSRVGSLVHILHMCAPDSILEELASDSELYTVQEDVNGYVPPYSITALFGLSLRILDEPQTPNYNQPGLVMALLRIFQAISSANNDDIINPYTATMLRLILTTTLSRFSEMWVHSLSCRPLVDAVRLVADRMSSTPEWPGEPLPDGITIPQIITDLRSWAARIERAMDQMPRRETSP